MIQEESESRAQKVVLYKNLKEEIRLQKRTLRFLEKRLARNRALLQGINDYFEAQRPFVYEI